MPKKAFDHAKLSSLLDIGLEESRGVGAKKHTTEDSSNSSSKRPSIKEKGPKKVKVSTQGIFLCLSPELTNALYRFQVEFREQHPEVSRQQTRISGAVEHLLRKQLSLKPLV